MTDMKIDDNPLSPSFGDLIYDNSRATTTVNQADSVAQKLSIKLRTFKTEWFINTDTGIPYYQEIFGKVRNKQTIDAIFQKAILEEPDVLEIVEFSSSIDVGRTYSLIFRVRTSLNQLTNNIQINVGA
jgi:hypothetical protein